MRRSSISDHFPVTSFLLLFILAFFALELIAQWKLQGAFPAPFSDSIGGKVTWLLGSLRLLDVKEDGQYWRLLSAAFLHGGFLHLLLNGIVLWDMGRTCEPFLSSWKFLVVYVSCALGGSVASLLHTLWFLDPLLGADMRQSVGASGALAGLIGLLLVYSIRCRNTTMRDALLRWIAMIVVFSLMVRGIDHAAHIGGFAVGAALGLTVDNYITSSAAARWRYPAYGAGALVLVCLGLAVRHYLLWR